VKKDATTTKASRRGFSLVELMAATLAGSVLALTVGAMLCFGYASWQRNTIAVDLQRDATIASLTMTHYVRQATGIVINGASSITMQGTNQAMTFSTSNSSSLYGGGTALVKNRVTFFTPVLTNNNQVKIRLVLQDGNESTEINTITTRRN
jgi:prepilin-type N-terminal cleavage/methylation domain-containing protein